MSDPHEIYLQPECCADEIEGRLWCDHDAPVDCEDGVPWTKYVIAEEYERSRAELAERREMDRSNSGLIDMYLRKMEKAEVKCDALREFIETLCDHIETYEPDGKRIAATIRTMRDAVLSHLAGDRNWRVRRAVARNASTPAEVLAKEKKEGMSDNADNLDDEVERLRAERDALKADAERYRLLRSGASEEYGVVRFGNLYDVGGSGVGQDFDWLTGGEEAVERASRQQNGVNKNRLRSVPLERRVRRRPTTRTETDMHTCPECGQACTCNGDIDDCLDICEDDADNCIHDCGFSDEDEDDGFGCRYPGECCMPGLHLLSECHTAADYEREQDSGATYKPTETA